MAKTLSMVSHKNYNLNAKWGFCQFLTSKYITCFIDSFTLKRKSQSIAYLPNGSEHIYWILDLENEMHSIWVIWSSLQECKGQVRVGHARIGVGEGRDLSMSGNRGSDFFGAAPARRSGACNARRGYLKNLEICPKISRWALPSKWESTVQTCATRAKWPATFAGIGTHHMVYTYLRNNRLKFKTSGKNTDHFRGIFTSNWLWVTERCLTCNQLDLETLGSWSRPIMPKHLVEHCSPSGNPQCKKENKRKEKIMPVHCTGMNMSPLSRCQTRQVVLWHKGLCLFWEVGSRVCKYVIIITIISISY